MAMTDFLSPNHHPCRSCRLPSSHKAHCQPQVFVSYKQIHDFTPSAPEAIQVPERFHFLSSSTRYEYIISGSHSGSVLSSDPALQVPIAKAGLISKTTPLPYSPKGSAQAVPSRGAHLHLKLQIPLILPAFWKIILSQYRICSFLFAL